MSALRSTSNSRTRDLKGGGRLLGFGFRHGYQGSRLSQQEAAEQRGGRHGQQHAQMSVPDMSLPLRLTNLAADAAEADMAHAGIDHLRVCATGRYRRQ
jgi:hypothetical protein